MTLKVEQFEKRLVAAMGLMTQSGDLLEMCHFLNFHPAIVHSLSISQETPMFQVRFLRKKNLLSRGQEKVGRGKLECVAN
jgi:hypothetical protein